MAPVSSSSWPSRPSLIFDSTSSRNALFSKNGLRHRRLQKGRAERVDADVVRRELDRHRLGEAFHGVLGGAIDGAARRADMAHLRRHVDDRAGRSWRRSAAAPPPAPRKGGAHVEARTSNRNPRPSRPADSAGRFMPALLTRMSNGSARGDGRSHGLDVRDVERQRIGLFAARTDCRRRLLDLASLVRAASVTCAPAPANADAAASPMPRPPPVTSARLPSRRKEGFGEVDRNVSSGAERRRVGSIPCGCGYKSGLAASRQSG